MQGHIAPISRLHSWKCDPRQVEGHLYCEKLSKLSDFRLTSFLVSERGDNPGMLLPKKIVGLYLCDKEDDLKAGRYLVYLNDLLVG